GGTRPARSSGADWGELAIGDADLDPTTGLRVKRAAESGAVERLRAMVSQEMPIVRADEAPADEAQLAVSPASSEGEVAVAAAPPPALARADVPAVLLEEHTTSPWDGHSGVTEVVNLDAGGTGGSQFEALLATAPRPGAGSGRDKR